MPFCDALTYEPMSEELKISLDSYINSVLQVKIFNNFSKSTSNSNLKLIIVFY